MINSYILYNQFKRLTYISGLISYHASTLDVIHHNFKHSSQYCHPHMLSLLTPSYTVFNITC